MKTKLHLLIAFMLTVSIVYAQETTANISMGTGYANDVFYKLSNGATNTYSRNDWDIAFLRTDARSFSLRANGGAGIQVFDVSNDPADWNSVDVTNGNGWTKLQNDETSWDTGAFDTGSADGAYPYGWGNYSFADHHITGDVVFVLKYLDGTYIKFFCEDYFNGYTFKYSSWSGTTWSADTTVIIPNSDNANNKFNYYSLKNNQAVVVEPGIGNWDLKFTRYTTDIHGDGSLYYLVTGVLHSDEVSVAQNEESSGMPTNPSLTYSDEINTIGHDWKTFNTIDYDVDQTQAFYVKYEDGTIYRLYFTDFSGSTSGDLTFKFENVTASLSIDDVSDAVSFGIYPNPSTDKQINLIYDINKLDAANNQVSIYSITGQKVFHNSLNKNSGFHNKNLDLSSLSNGIYLLKFSSGNYSVTKRLVLN
ncbi:T9SS type A sorting domain-containing protein [Flavivirga jejuensis]|uniref:T9SS type A sorting domain-containing protein n=1 Tax=Flavivirga jejuensis TaxID=870487 RepID=A0ABT8WHT2_9FLAO|nr:T9SS type A sorting domain-containing protein [Flavivirga jejuensis]MDO5972711.1 T9SS type A sorting domain-containing protein [Flavivirga jejuensis]